MEKSIEKIWNEAFIDEQSLAAPKINDIYNQKSKSIIAKFKRTYEFDNKTLIPLAILCAVAGFLLSEVIIGLYVGFLILGLYFFNSKLLNRFNNIDVKSDNLTYLKSYRDIITGLIKVTRKLLLFPIPLAVLSIFILAFYTMDMSFISKFISEEITLLHFISLGLIVALTFAVTGRIAYELSTKLLYGTLISKLDDIIKELELLKK